jgi:hypothetical protein
LLPDVPVLLDTTFESLAQGFFNEDSDILHQDEGKHSHIQQEQAQLELHQLQQDLNTKFARTIKLFEERREPRVQRAVHVLCQAD